MDRQAAGHSNVKVVRRQQCAFSPARELFCG